MVFLCDRHSATPRLAPPFRSTSKRVSLSLIFFPQLPFLSNSQILANNRPGGLGRSYTKCRTAIKKFCVKILQTCTMRQRKFGIQQHTRSRITENQVLLFRLPGFHQTKTCSVHVLFYSPITWAIPFLWTHTFNGSRSLKVIPGYNYIRTQFCSGILAGTRA